jgi:hypothetical protein
MSYVMSTISWRVRLLCWNHDLCLMDTDSRHLAPATILRHHQQNPSGILGPADHLISRTQVIHCTLLQSKRTSFRNCMTIAWSLKRYVRKNLFGPPPSRSMRRQYENLGTNGIPRRCSSYSVTTLEICATIPLSHEKERYYKHFIPAQAMIVKTVTGRVWQYGCFIKKRRDKCE